MEHIFASFFALSLLHSLGHLSMNDYVLVVVVLFLSTLLSLSTLIMILQAKCSFELMVPNKLSSENMYQFMQLRSKKKSSFFPAGHLWSECFLLYLCLAKYKAKDVT